MMKLGEYFSQWEFERSQTASRLDIDNVMTSEALANSKELVIHVLDPLRELLQSPININSGFRSIKLNKAIGGSATSQHCLGQAADIESFALDNAQLARLIAQKYQFDQLILECYRQGDPRSGWVHVSYKGEGNRNQILTYSKGVYTEGLPT